MEKIILSHEETLKVCLLFLCSTVSSTFFRIMKNYRLIPNQLTARSEEQILHTRCYQGDNEMQMTFQEELLNPFSLDKMSSAP